MPNVLVTGANRGIGLEFVRQYAADGWDVIACCRAPGKATELLALAQNHKNVKVEGLDVGDFAAVAVLADKYKGTAIDVLINNAGILSGTSDKASAVSGDEDQSFGSIDPDGWLKIMQVNVLAPLKITEAFVDHVAASKERKLVMISSGWGSIANLDGDFYGYKLSKAALNAGAKNLAADLRERKICVASFSPGWVQTDMGGKEADITPKTSVHSLRKAIAALSMKQSGGFFNRNGEVYPW